MTMKQMIVDKAKSGGYGFSYDYVLDDYKVKHSNINTFIDCVRDAVINYCEWQLGVVKYYDYKDTLIQGVLVNIKKQMNAYEAMKSDWDLALLLEEMEVKKDA